MLAPFPAVAGLAVATEWCREVWPRTIDLNLTGTNAVGHFAGFIFSALHIACQAIDCVIGHFDSVIHILIWDHDEHWPEDFLTRNGHVIGDIRKHGWTREKALVEAFRTAWSTGDQRRAFLDAGLDQILNLLVLVAVRNRTDSAR